MWEKLYTWKKLCIAGVKTLAQSPIFWMAAREISAVAPWTAHKRHVHLAMHKTFLTHGEIVLAHTSMCCLLLHRNREDTQEPFFLKGTVQHK